MKSKWYQYKKRAISLRLKGNSIRAIESKLKIPRSTLSGWFKYIKLPREVLLALDKNRKDGLVLARKKAVEWHNKEKDRRSADALLEAKKTLDAIDTTDRDYMDLALSILYLGEGRRKSTSTSMGNSNPLILRFFISTLISIYNVSKSKIKCSLHLRCDQKPDQLKKYWARELGLPLGNFTGVSVDRRTAKTKTYKDYKGVCVVSCGSVAIQRKLVYLSKLYCEKVVAEIANMGA
jgi:hypothetical protein